MAFISGALHTRADIPSDSVLHDTLQVPFDRAADWAEVHTPARAALNQVVSYILLVLAALLGGAAYIGVLELIQPDRGPSPFLDTALIGASVAMLTIVTWWLLGRDSFKARPGLRAKDDRPEPVMSGAPVRRSPEAHGTEGTKHPFPMRLAVRPPPRTNPEFRQRFGSYATHAQAEFANYRDLDEMSDPTASEIGSQALMEQLAAALGMAGRDEDPGINVELRRETATFQVPVSQAALPEALANLTGAEPQLELTPAAPEILAAGATIESLLEDKSLAGDAGEFDPPLVLRRMVD